MGRLQPNVLTHKYHNFSTLSILVCLFAISYCAMVIMNWTNMPGVSE